MEKKNKGAVWVVLRISFWLMAALWAFAILITTGTIHVSETFGTIISVLLLVSIVVSFISSIIHLTKHEEKALAIVALVISSFMILVQILYIILDSIYAAG